MIIATSRYQARALIVASELAPVRTTLGYPRFRLGYELAGELKELAPTRSIFRLDWPEFEPAFRARLDRLDVEEILGRLNTIAESVGAAGAVLLCFEDVLAGEHCHRRLIAEWLQEHTGEAVPELGAD